MRVNSDMLITFTKVSLPNGWLGNMAPYPVGYQGVTWKTNEHLFQALRFDLGSPVRRALRDELSPMGAKFLAKGHASDMVVEPMSDTDLDNMRLCLRLKITQHPDLKKKLLETGVATIIEDVTNRKSKGNHDFWGARLVGERWVGTNTLGRLWMELRALIQTLPLGDRIRFERAILCNRSNISSVREAIRMLQSTDHPSLVCLHDDLMDRLDQLENRT